MKLYLFQDPGDKVTLSAFLAEATPRSLKALRIFALLALSWAVLIISASRFLPEKLIVDNEDEFLIIQITLLADSLLYLLLYRVTKRLRLAGKPSGSRLLLTVYSFVVAAHFLGVSFLAQYNPGNTMTFFLLGCFIITVLVLLLAREILFVTIALFVVLLVLMPMYQADPQKVAQSYITGFIILLMTYFMSRIWFSTQYNQFLQLQTIRKKNEEINRINILQTDMLAIVAHDLRTPVNNIAAAIELIEGNSMTAQETRQAYQMIRMSCRETDHFIHDLIDMARNQDNQPLQTSVVELNGLIRDIAEAWRRQTGDSKQIVVIDPPEPVEAEVHVQKIQRALNNLMHNAVKFTPDKGTIKLMLNANEEMIHIAVSDNGIGIPGELLPEVFDRFTKAGRRGLKGEKSYGLGLSICRQIVAQHHGSIRVESTDGRGTVFHIILPRHMPDMHTAAKPTPAYAGTDPGVLSEAP